MLKDRGVDVIFGIPGVHNQEMYRGIEEAGITHVLARHEQGAGFMADGYARATGKPGVAYVITGPGLCNIMTPMGQAYSDSVPMLVISSCLDETAARRGQLHQMKDQRAAAETVCDWSEEARTAKAAYALIDRAMAEFTASRPRPKHLQVSIGLLEAEAPAARAPLRPTSRATGTADGVAQALALLEGARRPLFVFGGGAQAGAEPARALLQRLGAASFTTYAGRGIVSPDAPLHFGSYLSRPDSADVVARADAVIAIGTELAEVDIWRPDLGHAGQMLRVDLDPESLTDAARADWHVQADAAAFLSDLLTALDGKADRHSDWTSEEVASARGKWRRDVEAEYPGIPGITDALRDCLPDGTMVYSDMTQFAYAATEVWDMDRPGHWHHPYGFGTLGYALPAAIGGAVARRGQPTLAIMGDYGFHYTMAELGVAVELGLSLPILLWDNGKLGAIEASMVGAQIAPNAVVARNPDFPRLAEAFGARAVRPSSLSEMQQEVRSAFDADGPTLIYVTPDLAR
ncbi:acetolactate synthase isozyme1 large subunit [Sulfitobacter alexandrii]|uniref:Acetolactate synthase isozyme1 large subunit n=2 Tax=Sulfitobacter alexandrii TaxID=1917485 RepID=A0A1J0WLU4_9RHOB|nr:acetolactate synthase isozyme1 large subunit [Sulfitobacter alexandrii]